MDQHQSPPVYSAMVAEPDFLYHQDDGERGIKSASTRSPTTVFAIAELSNVFRVADDAIERVGHQEQESDSNSHRRCPTPSIVSSFATDVELSTFSEDTEEGDEEGPECDDIDHNQSRFTVRRRRLPMSIFRSVSGTKRRCNILGEEHDVNTTPTKRHCSAPRLCHANPIGSDDDVCDVNAIPLLSSSYPLSSPFKRVCRSSSNSSNTSSFTSLFADEAFRAIPATISNNQAGSTFSIMPRHLQYVPSLQALPILTATNIFKTDGDEEDDKEN